MAITTSPRSLGRDDAPTTGRVGTVISQMLSGPLADYYLLATAITLLVGFGITMVLSSSSVIASAGQADPYFYVKKQVIFAILGAAFAWWLSRRTLTSLKVFGWGGLFLAFGLLMLTFVPGIGFEVNGNRNWIAIPGINQSLQPSEFAKIAIVVWGSAVLGAKVKKHDLPGHLLIPFVPVTALLVGLVVLGNDVGTAAVMIAIIMGMLFFVGTSWRILTLFLLGGAAGVAALVYLSPNRMARIFAFVDPSTVDELSRSQAMQALYALASGGWWGQGLGGSRMKWGSLAEAHTDYVFAIVGEELGFVGAIVVLAIFCTLTLTGLRVALRSDVPFARYCAAGITTWFAVQALVNVAVVLRLLPVLGVPLPFISYGGSALLANLIAVGFLLACARQEPEARAVLSRRGKKAVPKVTSIVDHR